jgi:hypothetical protein
LKLSPWAAEDRAVGQDGRQRRELVLGASLAAVSIPGRGGCLELFSLQGNLIRGD